MSTPAVIGLVVYSIGALVCWRVAALSEVEQWEDVVPHDELWCFALLWGFIVALVWPLVLLFARSSAAPSLPCPVCGASDRNCEGKVTSECGRGEP